MTQQSGGRCTYVLFDGENIDATLGASVLSRRPNPDERPRWERVQQFAEQQFGNPVKGLFFLAAHSETLPMSFVQALLAMSYTPIPLSGAPGQKVVDIGIQRMLEALADNDGDVLLASHDGDFLPQVQELVGTDRRVGMLVFREFMNSGFAAMMPQGLEVFDLERDVGAFTSPLPRVRIIPIDEFDPTRYL